MYRVDVTHTQDYSFTVKSKDYEFVIDSNGAAGITPPDALLASLGSCVGVYVRKYAEGAKLKIENFSIRVEGDLCKEPPARFKEINISIDLKELILDERRKKSFSEFIKNCPVHNTLESHPEVKISVT
jgi:uncharacterized OsmC-like protein